VAVFKFDHIHLRSPNPEETAAYYERMFDATVMRSVKGGKARVDVDLGGQMIFIAPVAADDDVAAAPQSPHMGLEHIGLIVTGIDDIAAELKAKGAAFTMEPTTIRPGTRIAFLRGPEDVSIELVDRNA
jgi:lactoylglutathione lyase